jgi:hypothetical protein
MQVERRNERSLKEGSRVPIGEPIFIVGAPRSGTSIFYQKMALHPDLAWISNIAKKFPSSWMLTRLLMLFRDDHVVTEANKVWRYRARRDDDFRDRSEVDDRVRRYLERVVRNQLRLFGKPRFLNKCPANALRIDFLDAVFPDAYFVHVVRDGRAVALSMLRSVEQHDGDWGIRYPGWRQDQGLPWIESCGHQWKRTIEITRESLDRLPEERRIEVRYEDLMEKPRGIFLAVVKKCRLACDEQVLEQMCAGLDSRNYKWREQFGEERLQALETVIGDTQRMLGYSVGS